MGYDYSKIQERSLGDGKTDLHFSMANNLRVSPMASICKFGLLKLLFENLAQVEAIVCRQLAFRNYSTSGESRY